MAELYNKNILIYEVAHLIFGLLTCKNLNDIFIKKKKKNYY